MTHIAGKPGKYVNRAHEEIKKNIPQLFVCGHSHILLVKQDPLFNMLWMNPGACGFKGFHQVKTVLRFCISKDRIHDLEVIELGKRI
jgi:predicted phosphodiesterase